MANIKLFQDFRAQLVIEMKKKKINIRFIFLFIKTSHVIDARIWPMHIFASIFIYVFIVYIYVLIKNI